MAIALNRPTGVKIRKLFKRLGFANQCMSEMKSLV